MQTAKKHPGGIKGTHGAVTAMLNLKQAGPQAKAQLMKIRDRAKQELERRAERRDQEVKRVKQRYA
jgi:hypothetical protein